MRGLKAKDLWAIVDFIYHGEASIPQEDLQGFLALAEELQLKGMAGMNNTGDSKKILNKSFPKNSSVKQEIIQPMYDEANQINNLARSRDDPIGIVVEEIYDEENVSNINYPISDQKSINPCIRQDNMDKSVMMKSIYDGENRWKCTVCGKATKGKRNMSVHIEIPMTGLSYPCNKCAKVLKTRNALNCHMSKHKRNT